MVPQLVLVQTGPSPVMLGALGTGGAGVAAGITGAVFGLMARSQFNEISDRINAGGAYATPAEVDEIDGRQTLANVMLVTAVVGLAAGAGLFVFEQEVADLLGIGAPPAPPAPDTTAPAEEAAPTAADEKGGVSLLTRPGSSTP